jgi:hypothetical protein
MVCGGRAVAGGCAPAEWTDNTHYIIYLDLFDFFPELLSCHPGRV